MSAKYLLSHDVCTSAVPAAAWHLLHVGRQIIGPAIQNCGTTLETNRQFSLLYFNANMKQMQALKQQLKNFKIINLLNWEIFTRFYVSIVLATLDCLKYPL